MSAFAIAAPTRQGEPMTEQGMMVPLLAPLPPAAVPLATGELEGARGDRALDALARGRWAAACSMSTAILARQTPDLDALGIFALCAAVTNDRGSAATALKRLREVEKAPYYALLADGVLFLRDRAPEKAQGSFYAALQARPGDPLARYFEGEALHARSQPVAAVAAFKASLRTWPEFAPAMTAQARLLAGPKASQADLRAAVSLAEQATRIEPMNRGYWKLLADLCRRTGQEPRANAIELQYLRPLLPANR